MSDNIGSVLAFFDALVLSEKLPVIDYGITFDSAMRVRVIRVRCHGSAPLLTTC